MQCVSTVAHVVYTLITNYILSVPNMFTPYLHGVLQIALIPTQKVVYTAIL